MLCDTWSYVAGSALLASERAGAWVSGVVSSSSALTGPIEVVPVALAVLTRAPSSMSAWVTTQAAVQVTDPVGNSVVAGQVTVMPMELVTSRSVIVVLPVLVTT